MHNTPHTNETKLKISLTKKGKPSNRKGVKLSKATKEKISLAKKGFKHSLEVRQKMSNSRKGSDNAFYNKVHSKITKDKMSLAKIGKRPPNFIKDRLSVHKKSLLRKTPEWKKWRKFIFERDKYTCQECKITGGYLEAHHIIPVRNSNTGILFSSKNGITLCRPCHKKTIWKESNYEKKYLAIVAAQM